MAGGNTCMYSTVQLGSVCVCVCVCLYVCVCPCMDTSMWVCVCVGLYTCISITSVYCMVRLEEVELWCVSTSSSTESDACQNPNSPVHSDTHHLPPSWTSSSLDIICLCMPLSQMTKPWDVFVHSSSVKDCFSFPPHLIYLFHLILGVKLTFFSHHEPDWTLDCSHF